MTEPLSDHRGLRPNRPALVATALGGCFVGLLPFVRFLSRWDRTAILIVVCFIAAALLVAFRSVTEERTEASDAPSPGEWLLGACAAAGNGAVASVIGFLIYAAAFWAARLWDVLASGSLPTGNPDAWGYWASVPSAFFMGLSLISVATEKLTRTLYPPTAGARSVYFPLLSQPGKLLAIGAAVAFAVIIAVTSITWGSMAVATAILVYAAMPLDRLSGEKPNPGKVDLIDAAERVLQEAGYAVVRWPRTGKPDIDPLIRSVTLLASSGPDAFAVEMKDMGRGGAPVEWTAASGVRTASTILEHEMTTSGPDAISVRPVLIIVGGSIAPSLSRFSEMERVAVVHLEATALGQVADGAGQQAELMASFRRIGLPIPARAGADRAQVTV